MRILEQGKDFKTRDLPADPPSFLRWLGQGAMLRIPGRDRSRTRVVVTLLHGNEPSGLRAMHRWLLADATPAVDVGLVIGAVETALAPPGFAFRLLPGRRDLNRCWRAPWVGGEGAFAQAVLETVRASAPECLVDLHNNTGHNPAYGVSPRVGAPERRLVSLFADRIIHAPLGLGTLVEATADELPSVTIECGKSSDPAADQVAFDGLGRVVSQADLELERGDPPALAVFHDPVRVRVRAGVELAFGNGPDDAVGLTISQEIDRHNFREVPPGAILGWLGADGRWPVEARGSGGVDRSEEFFRARGRVFETRRSLVPVMMTTDRESALADCLFYAVEPGPPTGSG